MMNILRHIITTIILLTNLYCLGQGQFERNKGIRFEIYTGTETDIKNYLDNNETDPIEGIWSVNGSGSIDGETFKQENGMKFAIIKDTTSNKRDYITIFVSTSDNVLLQNTGWKTYYLIGKVDKTSYPNVYLSERYKSAFEIAGAPNSNNYYIDEHGLLSSSASFWSKGIKFELNYVCIRTYPAFSSSSTLIGKTQEFSGSGFLITNNGVIATNHHVIEGGKNISIELLKEGKSEIYNAKVLTADKGNDIALLSIDDKNFLPISSIPYIVTNKADVGESVFTMGFPLNDIMGKNFKVTNGIISSNSGIQDDIRYYQITVPIQPGNSGGPLFNENGDIIGLTTSRLSGESIGTKIENANYAIKSNYLLLLTEMAGIKDQLPKQNQLATKELKDQVEILKEFVCLIHVVK